MRGWHLLKLMKARQVKEVKKEKEPPAVRPMPCACMGSLLSPKSWVLCRPAAARLDLDAATRPLLLDGSRLGAVAAG